MSMLRHLQHAKLGLERHESTVRDEDERGYRQEANLLFPYVVSMLVVIGMTVYLARFLYARVIRVYLFGEEPPFDPIHAEQVMNNLTPEQQKESMHAMLTKLAKQQQKQEAKNNKSSSKAKASASANSTEEKTVEMTEKDTSHSSFAVGSGGFAAASGGLDAGPVAVATPESLYAEAPPKLDGVDEEQQQQQKGTANPEENDLKPAAKTKEGEEDVLKMNGAPMKDLLDEDEHVCPICLGDLEEDGGDVQFVKSDKCRHVFHIDCILEWIQSGHEDCPVCRVRMFDREDKFRAALAYEKTLNGGKSWDWKQFLKGA